MGKKTSAAIKAARRAKELAQLEALKKRQEAEQQKQINSPENIRIQSEKFQNLQNVREITDPGPFRGGDSIARSKHQTEKTRFEQMQKLEREKGIITRRATLDGRQVIVRIKDQRVVGITKIRETNQFNRKTGGGGPTITRGVARFLREGVGGGNVRGPAYAILAERALARGDFLEAARFRNLQINDPEIVADRKSRAFTSATRARSAAVKAEESRQLSLRKSQSENRFGKIIAAQKQRDKVSSDVTAFGFDTSKLRLTRGSGRFVSGKVLTGSETKQRSEARFQTFLDTFKQPARITGGKLFGSSQPFRISATPPPNTLSGETPRLLEVQGPQRPLKVQGPQQPQNTIKIPVFSSRVVLGALVTIPIAKTESLTGEPKGRGGFVLRDSSGNITGVAGSLNALFGPTEPTIKERLQAANPIRKKTGSLEDFGRGFTVPFVNLGKTFAAIPEALKRDIEKPPSFNQFFGKQTQGQKFFDSDIAPTLEQTPIDRLITGQPNTKSTSFNVGGLVGEAALFLTPIGIGKAAGFIKNSATTSTLFGKIPKGTPKQKPFTSASNRKFPTFRSTNPFREKVPSDIFEKDTAGRFSSTRINLGRGFGVPFQAPIFTATAIGLGRGIGQSFGSGGGSGGGVGPSSKPPSGGNKFKPRTFQEPKINQGDRIIIGKNGQQLIQKTKTQNVFKQTRVNLGQSNVLKATKINLGKTKLTPIKSSNVLKSLGVQKIKTKPKLGLNTSLLPGVKFKTKTKLTQPQAFKFNQPITPRQAPKLIQPQRQKITQPEPLKEKTRIPIPAPRFTRTGLRQPFKFTSPVPERIPERFPNIIGGPIFFPGGGASPIITGRIGAKKISATTAISLSIETKLLPGPFLRTEQGSGRRIFRELDIRTAKAGKDDRSTFNALFGIKKSRGGKSSKKKKKGSKKKSSKKRK